MTNSGKPPNAGKGRPKGARNKTTSLLSHAILEAAAKHGLDDVWVPDFDETQPNRSKAYSISAQGPCLVRLNPSVGSCKLQVVPQLKEKYR
ncbi:MAG: hypothetical protein GY807_04490 [Gammaproteobacteria bacterium]|nr:hypothetical protein [Gammaproteobacteria bacterium]